MPNPFEELMKKDKSERREMPEFTTVHSVLDYTITQMEDMASNYGMVSMISDVLMKLGPDEAKEEALLRKNASQSVRNMLNNPDRQLANIRKAIVLLRDLSVEQRITNTKGI